MTLRFDAYWKVENFILKHLNKNIIVDLFTQLKHNIIKIINYRNWEIDLSNKTLSYWDNEGKGVIKW